MKRFKLAAFLAIALGLPCLNQAYAQQRSPIWEVFDNVMNGKDIVKVCLINQNGRWTEGDTSRPNECQEMLVAAKDTHSIWPDSSFYLSRSLQKSAQGRSRYGYVPATSTLFKMDAFANYALIPNNDAVLHAFNESGAEKRLDDQYAVTAEHCLPQYKEATTIQQVENIDKSCRAYVGVASHEAYNRALANEENGRQQKIESVAAKYQPKCSKVSFSGIVAGNDGDLDALRNATDIEDIVASHPLYCGPSGFTQTYVCGGAAVLSGKSGYIVSWSNNTYQVVTPIDLKIGRKDALIYISRSDATCLDQAQPSLNFETNLENFLKYHNTHR